MQHQNQAPGSSTEADVMLEGFERGSPIIIELPSNPSIITRQYGTTRGLYEGSWMDTPLHELGPRYVAAEVSFLQSG